MMAKDSVKKRIAGEGSNGLSFTEFSYQLLQGYDYLHLYEHEGCRVQLGGSDQWGNITTGCELIRRKVDGQAFAITCPLITKADGTKFGKTESGNVWLDPRYTSPYKFYQFWMNVSDEDAGKFIRIFTSLAKEEIEALEKAHAEEPHKRLLQSKLAEEITVMVHSREDYETAVQASQILFGRSSVETLHKLDESTFLSVFEGVPMAEVAREKVNGEMGLMDLLVGECKFFASNSELRKLIQSGGVSLNGEKVTDFQYVPSEQDLLNSRYMLIQRGKKNFYLVKLV